MLLIKSKDEGSQERVLTLSTGRKGRGREVTLRIYEPDGKTEFSGNLLASIVLSEADASELKRNL